MDRLELAALYTLQDRLARNSESHGCFEHSDKAGRCFFHESSTQLIGDANAPGSTGCELFAGDEAVVEPAMNSRGSETEYLGSLVHCGEFTSRGFFGRSKARDVAIAAQTPDLLRGEPLTVSGFATLAIEYASD